MAGEKLVRDKLEVRIPPEQLRIVGDDRLIGQLLRSKLDEELAELAASAYGDVGEYADVIEVLYALANRAGIAVTDIETARLAKLAERGGFTRGLVWTGEPEAVREPTTEAVADARTLGLDVPPLGETHVFSDGACSGNPGPGGWGAVIVNEAGRVHQVGGNDAKTTNNRMELSAAIGGLVEAAKGSAGRIVLFLDSKYVVDGLGWLHGWRKRGWKTASGSAVKNIDLWQALDEQIRTVQSSGVMVTTQWVRGHAGNPGNELADLRARAGIADLRR